MGIFMGYVSLPEGSPPILDDEKILYLRNSRLGEKLFFLMVDLDFEGNLTKFEQ